MYPYHFARLNADNVKHSKTESQLVLNAFNECAMYALKASNGDLLQQLYQLVRVSVTASIMCTGVRYR